MRTSSSTSTLISPSVATPKAASATGPRSTLSITVMLAFAAVYVIWGSTYLGIRIAIETLPPFAMAGARFVLAGALLYTFLRLRGAPRPPLRTWRGALLIGGLMMFGGNGLVTWAQQTVPSAFAALLVATMPLWMVVLDATLHGGPKPGLRISLGLITGMAGVALLVGPSGGGVALPGAALLVLAALSWSQGSLLSRTADLPSSPWMAAAMQMLAGGGILLLAASVTGEWARVDLAAVSLRSIGALLYLALFGSIVAHSAYLYLLKTTSASAVATYAFVNPVIAMVLGWATGEAIGGRALAGAGLIIGAVAMIHWARVRARRRRPAVHPAAKLCTQGETP